MIEIISPMIKQFLPFAQERMGFSQPPKLFLRGDDKNAQNPLGKTAYYDPRQFCAWCTNSCETERIMSFGCLLSTKIVTTWLLGS